MNRKLPGTTLFGLCLCLQLVGSSLSADELKANFLKPPASAKPWVYWFWLNGNITSNGITADLEAMQRVGIGGVLIMEVDQGAPVGPVSFMGPQWRNLFQHVNGEARRLGLEVNMNNDAGWNGSGGPWIAPEQSMQTVVWGETNLSGPLHFEAALVSPEASTNFYRDIAVLAFPATDEYRIPDIQSKAAFQKARRGKRAPAGLAPKTPIIRTALTNLTARMNGNGRLTWDVPPGEWTVVRFGHTTTGVQNAPAPKSGRGLECDKLSPEGIAANYAGMMSKLVTDAGFRSRNLRAGLVATHIDSWENGTQNWTARMRAEFEKRRGYDLLPFLPVLTGRVVGSLEISERFLWDLRQTISELVVQNYAGGMRRLAHAQGLRFTVEAYGSPCDAIPYGGQADEPMGEFWTPSGSIETCRGMASAAHVYGKRIVGAEAFTSGNHERWLEHPATLKALGDRAFCEGINRFVFHRYAMQPWLEYQPGMTMGPWGQHYERTQTWWNWTPSWHEYLARCQFMLRQGLFVADICYLQAEAPPQGFGNHEPDGFGWDECTAEAVLTRMSVKQGRLVLPDGMSYRLLALSEARTMTPPLLRKLKSLVKAGATVVGPRPLKSPSLSNYPKCDAEVDQLARELWGDCDGRRVTEHAFGRGRVFWGPTPAAVLQQSGLPRDFASERPVRYIHRAGAGTDIYFVANPQPFECLAACAFRVAGKVPEIWRPDTGSIERAAVCAQADGVTRVGLPLGPAGSAFVVFRQRSGRVDSLVSVKHAGKTLLSAELQAASILKVTRARYGVLDDPKRVRDVTQQVQQKLNAGEVSFPVNAMADLDNPAPGAEKTLVVDYTADDKPFSVRARDSETLHVSSDAVKVTVEKALYGVLDDPKRTRDVRAKLQRLVDAGESRFMASRMAQGDDPAYLVVKTLDLEYTRDGKPFKIKATDRQLVELAPVIAPPKPVVAARYAAGDKLVLETSEPGEFELASASGRTQRVNVPPLTPPLELTGPWRVRFAAGGGASAEISLDHLISWTERPEPGVKYFSGIATYSKTIPVSTELLVAGKRIFLDLGRVQAMAQVKLNGRELGTLWKPPFRLEVTGALKPGDNELEVRVVNLWVNRMIGDEQLPEDSERNPNGTLKEWPQWIQEGKPSPSGRFTFTSWRLWKKDEPLLESGLLGPVKLEFAEEVLVEPF
jgi:hypothetical protein